jgi:ankyrin repeat protein
MTIDERERISWGGFKAKLVIRRIYDRVANACVRVYLRLFYAEGLAEAVKNAAIAGDVAALKQLVATHGGISVRMDGDPKQLTALHWAAGSGNIEAVRLLLSPLVGADPRAARINNFTPLHAASMQGHAALCEVLIGAGADVNVQTNPQGYAPLHSAAFGGHAEAIRMLLAHGADRTLVNYRNERPVDTARRTGQAEGVRVLEA